MTGSFFIASALAFLGCFTCRNYHITEVMNSYMPKKLLEYFFIMSRLLIRFRVYWWNILLHLKLLTTMPLCIEKLITKQLCTGRNGKDTVAFKRVQWNITIVVFLKSYCLYEERLDGMHKVFFLPFYSHLINHVRVMWFSKTLKLFHGSLAGPPICTI